MADWTDTSPAELVEAHLARPANTARNYAADLATLAEFLKAPSHEAAVMELLDRSRGAAERIMSNYVAWLRKRYPESINTIRRKAQSVMGLIAKAHRFRVVDWMIEPLKLPAGPPIRDTRGPSRLAVEAMIEQCQKRTDAKGARDEAMLSLMAWAALRCNETLSLDLRHVDIDAREIEVLSKGLWGRDRHPIPMAATEAIERWLGFRGTEDGPLFTTCNRAEVGSGNRLTYKGAYKAVRELGCKAGVRCSPHKLRHFAATEHLKLTNGNVPWAMALTRHRDPKTLMIYNDERMTRAREAMELVSAGIPHYRLRA